MWQKTAESADLRYWSHDNASSRLPQLTSIRTLPLRKEKKRFLHFSWNLIAELGIHLQSLNS